MYKYFLFYIFLSASISATSFGVSLEEEYDAIDSTIQRVSEKHTSLLQKRDVHPNDPTVKKEMQQYYGKVIINKPRLLNWVTDTLKCWKDTIEKKKVSLPQSRREAEDPAIASGFLLQILPALYADFDRLKDSSFSKGFGTLWSGMEDISHSFCQLFNHLTPQHKQFFNSIIVSKKGIFVSPSSYIDTFSRRLKYVKLRANYLLEQLNKIPINDKYKNTLVNKLNNIWTGYSDQVTQEQVYDPIQKLRGIKIDSDTRGSKFDTTIYALRMLDEMQIHVDLPFSLRFPTSSDTFIELSKEEREQAYKLLTEIELGTTSLKEEKTVKKKKKKKHKKKEKQKAQLIQEETVFTNNLLKPETQEEEKTPLTGLSSHLPLVESEYKDNKNQKNRSTTNEPLT